MLVISYGIYNIYSNDKKYNSMLRTVFIVMLGHLFIAFTVMLRNTCIYSIYSNVKKHMYL